MKKHQKLKNYSYKIFIFVSDEIHYRLAIGDKVDNHLTIGKKGDKHLTIGNKLCVETY